MTVVRGLMAALLVTIIFAVMPGCSPKASDVVVLEVGTSKVSLVEYEDFYTRNSGSRDAAKRSSTEEREHFLDLLTNYKLKLQDAYDNSLLDDPEIRKELAEYRSSLASTFMLEREITEPGIKQLYERRKVNIHAGHILLSVKPDASPEDTLKAYTKARDLIQRAKSGESFDSLAIQYSEDPSVKSNHGDLYYFSSGVWVKPFEDGAYALKKGEISPLPVRSVFGYHIIKVLDIEPSRSLRVRHIMARFQSMNPDSADSAGALMRIHGMQDSLKKGWDFEKLTVKLSEDAGSANDGGLLPWFERRRFVEPFERAAFALKPNQLSDIVRTPFGFHLIRLDSVTELASYTQLHDQLKSVYQKARYNDDFSTYLVELKKEFNYSFNEQTLAALLSQLDSTKTTDDSAWDGTVSKDVRAMTLLTVGTRSFSVDEILSVFARKTEYRATSLRRPELTPKFERIAETVLLDAKSAGLESRYPEFAALMKEYTDGVVLYKAEQLEVWNKTSVTDSALKAYFERNRDKFIFPERVNINEINLESDTLAVLVYDSLVHGADFSSLASRWNDDQSLKLQKGARGLVNVETDEASKHAASLNVGEFSEPIDLEQGGSVIVQLVGREPARQKTYEEAGAEVSNAYQEYASKQLEQNWIERIKQRHPIKQYKENLKKAFESQHPSR
ncbi:MAG: peptidylprolyl isomerase [Ignavibacteriae bacterium]|nr:peptidylprolyl isomerase [Ignavibacteria bacterium]MBI3365044.1 peptidylprolyl isomerase [Ignavibacteriota bacterium]